MQKMPSRKQAPVVGIEHRPDLRPLTEDEVRFEVDMCIGCDRCMNACPVPMSSLVHIADLNRATISDEISPLVARFTDECVMCGSCVPECPVDNHRDLLMLSLKQRLGVSWDGSVDMNRLLDYLPPGWNLSLLVSRLREQPMFSDPQIVPENYLLHMVTTSKMLSLLPGSVLVREGEYGRSMYFLLEGHCELTSVGSDGTVLPVAVLRRGEYLGEQGMLTGQQRNATARARTACVVLEVPEQVMQRLMELVPAVRRFFGQLNNARSIESLLGRMALFQGIAAADLYRIAEETQVRQYDRDERLFSALSKWRAAQRRARAIINLMSASSPTAREVTTSRADLIYWEMAALSPLPPLHGRVSPRFRAAPFSRYLNAIPKSISVSQCAYNNTAMQPAPLRPAFSIHWFSRALRWPTRARKPRRELVYALWLAEVW